MTRGLAITVVLVAIGMTSFAHKKDVDYLQARRNGADAKIVVSLVNDAGDPVSNAAVRVLMGMNFREKAYYINGTTDADGRFVIEGRTTGNEIEIDVVREGYYRGHKKLCLITMGNEYEVKNGRWQPWGMKVDVPMRVIKNPISLIKRKGLFSKW